MNIFTQNPTITIAVIVFLVCVIIGFFADKYFKKKEEIKNILNKEDKEDNLSSKTLDNKNNQMGNQTFNDFADKQQPVTNNQSGFNNVNSNSYYNNVNTTQNIQNTNSATNQNNSNLSGAVASQVNLTNQTITNPSSGTINETSKEISPYNSSEANKTTASGLSMMDFDKQKNANNADDNINNMF